MLAMSPCTSVIHATSLGGWQHKKHSDVGRKWRHTEPAKGKSSKSTAFIDSSDKQSEEEEDVWPFVRSIHLTLTFNHALLTTGFASHWSVQSGGCQFKYHTVATHHYTYPLQCLQGHVSREWIEKVAVISESNLKENIIIFPTKYLLYRMTMWAWKPDVEMPCICWDSCAHCHQQWRTSNQQRSLNITTCMGIGNNGSISFYTEFKIKMLCSCYRTLTRYRNYMGVKVPCQYIA